MRVITLAVFLGAVIASPSFGQASFEPHLEFGNGHTLTVAWADFDGDGDQDLAVGNFGGASELYVNQGDGTFVGHDEFGAGQVFAIVWGDFDNDGDADAAVADGGSLNNRLYVNNGDGTLSGHDEFGAGKSIAMAWADFDLDGDLDLAVGNGIINTSEQNRLYVNNGDGTFSGMDRFGALKTDSVAWADVDGDGYPDLAAGNGGFSAPQSNALYTNDAGSGNFTLAEPFGSSNTSSVSWADPDNDGDFDLGLMAWDGGQSQLYFNDGSGSFNAAPRFGVGDPNTLAWGDFDFDGDLDLAQGNGDFNSAAQNLLWVNDGTAAFAPEAQFGVGSTDGVAWADVDGDGDLDLAVGNEHTTTRNYLYTNNGPVGGSVAILLQGHFHDLGSGYSNRDAIGAELRFYEAGFLGDRAHLLGARLVSAHGGFACQNERTVRFGLGASPAVDVRIKWPGSGGSHIVQDVHELQAGASVTIDEASVVLGPGEATQLRLSRAAGAMDPVTLDLGWEASCTGGASDYAIFEGTLGDWDSHVEIDCSDDGGDLEESVLSAAGDRYYLVVPLSGSSEGSYGLDSQGGERPTGLAVCRPRYLPSGCS